MQTRYDNENGLSVYQCRAVLFRLTFGERERHTYDIEALKACHRPSRPRHYSTRSACPERLGDIRRPELGSADHAALRVDLPGNQIPRLALERRADFLRDGCLPLSSDLGDRGHGEDSRRITYLAYCDKEAAWRSSSSPQGSIAVCSSSATCRALRNAGKFPPG